MNVCLIKQAKTQTKYFKKKIKRKIPGEYNKIYLSNLQDSQNVSLETHLSLKS